VSEGISTAKGIGTITKIALQGGVNVAQGAAQAINHNDPYGPANAAKDFALGLGSAAFGEAMHAKYQNTSEAKALYKEAHALENAAKRGRPRVAQTMRATAAMITAETYGAGKAAKTVNQIFFSLFPSVASKAIDKATSSASDGNNSSHPISGGGGAGRGIIP
jgi:hypothetical protein